jgi:arylformamidase
MRIYDVSVPISEQMPVYPGDPKVTITDWLSLDKGDPANVTMLDLGAHAGTHVDAPAHFIRGGRKVESMDLETLMGEVHVIAMPEDVVEVCESHIESLVPMGVKRVLFKTRNSSFWGENTGEFRSDYTFISAAAARRLVTKGIRLVGIDYLSVERFQSSDFATHEALLSNGVIIIEGLDLSRVPGGKYELICLPLKVAGGSGDGAPARVVLRSTA